jgi:hypothetical protein
MAEVKERAATIEEKQILAGCKGTVPQQSNAADGTPKDVPRDDD